MALEAARNSLVAGLAYFDMFGHPLTLAEALRFRYAEGGGAGETAVAADVLNDPRVESMNGLYFLRGRGHLVRERMQRERATQRKFARARAAAAMFARIPGIKFVAACNSLAFGAANDDSDIDLFVATEPGALWSSRLAAAGLMHALGMRPTATVQKDRICLSFFATTDALDFSAVALPDDPYLRYWVATLSPLYDAGGVGQKIFDANAWVRKSLPGYAAADAGLERAVTPRRAALPQMVLHRAEALARRAQERRFPDAIRSRMNKDTTVVVSDAMLKFHVVDRREEYARDFRARLKELGV